MYTTKNSLAVNAYTQNFYNVMSQRINEMTMPFFEKYSFNKFCPFFYYYLNIFWILPQICYIINLDIF